MKLHMPTRTAKKPAPATFNARINQQTPAPSKDAMDFQIPLDPNHTALVTVQFPPNATDPQFQYSEILAYALLGIARNKVIDDLLQRSAQQQNQLMALAEITGRLFDAYCGQADQDHMEEWYPGPIEGQEKEWYLLGALLRGTQDPQVARLQALVPKEETPATEEGAPDAGPELTIVEG